MQNVINDYVSDYEHMQSVIGDTKTKTAVTELVCPIVSSESAIIGTFMVFSTSGLVGMITSLSRVLLGSPCLYCVQIHIKRVVSGVR